MDTEFALRDLTPKVQAAYGRAADATGAGTFTNPPPEAPAPAEPAPAATAGPPAPPLIPEPAPQAAAPTNAPKSIEEQKAFIAQDVARQMMAAGRPAEEAEAAGKLKAARVATRAARMKGALGTPEELYNRESAEISGPGGRKAPPVPQAPPVAQKLAEEFKPGPAPKAPEPAEHEITTTEVKQNAPRGAAARDPSTWSALEFLTSKGGISPDERNISDLRTIFGTKNKFVPGFGQVIRPGGMSFDRALEALVEAGYIHDEGRASGRESEVTHKDLTDLIDAENRGQKQYRQGQEQAEKAEDPQEREYRVHQAIDEALKAADVPMQSVTTKLRERVVEIMDKEGISDPVDAFERAVMELDENASRTEDAPTRSEPIPGWDVDDAGAARGAGEATPSAPDQALPRVGEPARSGGEAPTEPGAEGQPQHLIPGVEPVTDRELAQRAADQPLRGGDQAPGGLFDEDARNQRELFQRDPAGPFYSAVEKAVDNVKLEKGSPEQWLGTIRNATGVKPEEMQWLGIEEWLKEQKGSVTKEQVQDFIRANSIQVEEVTKGEPGTHTLGDAAIADDVAALRARGIEAEQNPEDASQMAFVLSDELGGDFLTAAEFKNDPELKDLAQHAKRIESHFYSSAPESQARYRELDRRIAGGERLTPAEMAELDRLEANPPTLSATKFAQYVMPGGENYRELLLTLPERPTDTTGWTAVKDPEGYARDYQVFDKDGKLVALRAADSPEQAIAAATKNISDGQKTNTFKSSHWDEANVLAHTRFNDRVIDGKKTLFIEEIQSDWHQKGRTEGYQGERPTDKAVEKKASSGFDQVWRGEKSWETTTEAERQEWRDNTRAQMAEKGTGVPDAPFKTTWPELAMKRMIRYAAEHGYEQVAWAPGDVQAARYDLSKTIDLVVYKDGKLTAIAKGGQHVINDKPVSEAELVDHIGKEAADKLINQEPHNGARTLNNADLKIGGEGMKAFYDQMLPKATNKLVKKFDTKVGKSSTPSDDFGKFDLGEADNGRWQLFERSTQDPIGPTFRSGADAQEWLKANGHIPNTEVHTLPITESLRDAATGEGFPLFQGARGKINLLEGRKPIIILMKDANASTAIHEFGHEFLEEMVRDAGHEAAPADLKADVATILKWTGLNSASDLDLSLRGGALAKATRAHEKFARGFEQYLREGTAPSAELASVFGKFKQWLMQIYQTIKGLGKPINEDIRGVFDRMLAENPERTVIAPGREPGTSLADLHEADAKHTEPEHAEIARDRIVAEANRAVTELPPQVQHEIQTALAEVEAARAAAQPAAEGGERPGGAAEVVAGGVQPEPKPAGERGGEEPGAELRGGAKAGGESAGVSGPERGPDSGAGPQSNPLAPTPARLIEPGEPKLVDKAGNVRIENLTSVEDVANAIRESAERNADFQAIRGQTTMGEMQNLADAILIDPGKVDESQLAKLFGGFQDMAPKIWALRKALVDSAQMVSNAMKLVRDEPSDANAVAFAMSMTRHDMMQSTLSRVTAESGRTLGMSFKNLQGWEAAKDLEQFMKENTGRTLFQLKMMAKMGASLDSPAKVSKFLRDSQKRNFPGMILEYWINGLISGLATHTTYTMGNGLMGMVRAIPDTAVAAALGKIREAQGETGAHVQFGEVGARLGAVGRGLPAAIEAAIEAGRSGVTTLLPGEVARPSMPFAGDSQLTVAKNATNEPVKWGDVQLQVAGIMRGMRDGIVAQAALLKAGGEAGAPTVGPIYSPLGQIPDIGYKGVNVLPLGTLARIPSRGVAVIHSFFRSMNYSMEKAADAYRTAATEGLQGQAFDRRAAQIWTDPSEAQMDKYRHTSTEQTLMGQGGEFTKRLGALMNVEVGGWKPLKFIDPFVHISSNIIKQTILERTPVGLLSPELRADLAGRKDPITGQVDIAARDMAQAKMLVGSALGMTFAGLAGQGYISGSGPTDRNEAAMWRQVGNQAHSVRIGDMWWDMHRLGPLGMLLSISADLYHVAHTAAEGEYLEAAQHLQHAITHNILDESFMRGPASLIEAIEDPDRYGQAYIKNMVASFVPYSVGLSQQARATDPYTRQARTIVDTIRNNIPGHLNGLFGDELLPKRDIWGEPMPSPDALVAAGLTAIYAKQMSTDPVNLAMIELGIGPAPVGRKIRNVELTDQMYDDFSRTAGRMTKQRLDAIVRSPDWQRWSPNDRANIIQETIKGSREVARGWMFGQYRSILRDATQARIDGFREAPEAIR